MAKKTVEKVQKSEPELIIPVDDFNRDKLGENVARQISGFIARKARRFGRPLHDMKTLQEASGCLDIFFREVSGENLTPDMRRVIHSVRLTLNKYYKSLGIDLLSVNIEPRDEKCNPMLVDGKDLRAPTLGVLGTSVGSDDTAETAAVGFKVKEGAEELHVLSEKLEARGFCIGERMPERLDNWDDNLSTFINDYPWNRGDDVVIPAGAMIALNTPVFDRKKFDKAGLPHFNIGGAFGSSQGIYFCRYLTEKAVMDVLRQQAVS